MKIDHIGLETKNLQKETEFYLSLGFVIEKSFQKSSPKMEAVVIRLGNECLELFYFENTNDPEIIPLKKHIGFAADNFEKDLGKFLSAGYEIVIPETKGTTVKRFLFLKDQKDNYFELIEK